MINTSYIIKNSCKLYLAGCEQVACPSSRCKIPEQYFMFYNVYRTQIPPTPQKHICPQLKIFFQPKVKPPQLHVLISVQKPGIPHCPLFWAKY